MRLGQIIELRTGNLQTAVARLSRQQILIRIGELLRRRKLSPVEGCRLWIEFETEVEASALQKLIVDLPRGARKRKRWRRRTLA